ncbi:MAG: hypothetical protein ACFFAN_15160 [Promethearchaeota archaeon]
MSIEKWLSKKNSKEKEKRIEKLFKSLPEEKVLDLKKRKIRELTNKKEKPQSKDSESEDFLTYVIEFRDWLNQRTYLKGDLNEIETWIINLYKKFSYEYLKKSKLNKDKIREKAIERYYKIPTNFLDEKTRIAINKKIRRVKRTNSDNYYLRKLKATIKEKLNEARYYEILKNILDS